MLYNIENYREDLEKVLEEGYTYYNPKLKRALTDNEYLKMTIEELINELENYLKSPDFKTKTMSNEDLEYICTFDTLLRNETDLVEIEYYIERFDVNSRMDEV